MQPAADADPVTGVFVNKLSLLNSHWPSCALSLHKSTTKPTTAVK